MTTYALYKAQVTLDVVNFTEIRILVKRVFFHWLQLKMNAFRIAAKVFTSLELVSLVGKVFKAHSARWHLHHLLLFQCSS